MIEAILVVIALNVPGIHMKVLDRYDKLEDCLVEAEQRNNKNGDDLLRKDDQVLEAGIEYVCLKVVRVTI